MPAAEVARSPPERAPEPRRDCSRDTSSPGASQAACRRRPGCRNRRDLRRAVVDCQIHVLLYAPDQPQRDCELMKIPDVNLPADLTLGATSARPGRVQTHDFSDRGDQSLIGQVEAEFESDVFRKVLLACGNTPSRLYPDREIIDRPEIFRGSGRPDALEASGAWNVAIAWPAVRLRPGTKCGK